MIQKLVVVLNASCQFLAPQRFYLNRNPIHASKTYIFTRNFTITVSFDRYIFDFLLRCSRFLHLLFYIVSEKYKYFFSDICKRTCYYHFQFIDCHLHLVYNLAIYFSASVFLIYTNRLYNHYTREKNEGIRSLHKSIKYV